MPVPDDLPVLTFPDQPALEGWLEERSDTAPGAYVKIAKKGTGVASVSRDELVESLLCFGWIDGKANRLDDTFYLQRITPRRPRSVWSRKNVEIVAGLTAAGRMREGGLATVRAAQADGRWERAYPGAADMTVPEDLARALAAEPAAQRGFEALDGTNRYAVLFRVHTASTPQTRARRIAAAVDLLRAGGRLY